MLELFSELTKHPHALIELAVVLWLTNAFVTSMPMPDPLQSDFRASVLYQWVFTALHTLVGGVKTAMNDPRLQAMIAAKIDPTQTKQEIPK